MHSHTLENGNRGTTSDALAAGGWIVACLCAQWCGTCGTYRAVFEDLAQRHPGMHFVWIDIEDQADVVGDLDVDNFPTLLIQKHDVVAFFGTMLPDTKLAERLIEAQTSLDDDELARQAASTQERRIWQDECNLRMLLDGAG
ncbi:MAG: thioredoxin family protein [Bdellovibrionales bacterium]|nr:thioredoxin family protein [Massilia sp.]